ncbi:hypothetical protein POL68_20590 [Stigmatella sp. ncwal1]|uniref:Lipoprotein n=1 Tax=Stigmatella ashevillensis TaxID=2995309 RepID=A0ABT5DDM2_9BACT|nr:hypothetical protein [Stigmatella ashevillena]MDC0710883.1 hypothetical protein [Stigmatella ashevillena]
MPREPSPLNPNALLLVPALALAAVACAAVVARQASVAVAASATLFLVPVVFRLLTRTWYRGLVLRGVGLFVLGFQLPLLILGFCAGAHIGCEPGKCFGLITLGAFLGPIVGVMFTVIYWLVGRPPA